MGPKTSLLPVVLALGCVPFLCAEPAGSWAGPRVIIIGVDGLSVDGVAKAHVPRMRELMERAAWTLEARGVLPTLSSPNWASAINGASPAQHGITSNGWLRHMVEFQPVCRAADGKFPTIFGVLRAAYPTSKIAVFHDWGGFADLLEKEAPDVLQHERGPAKTTAAAIAYWRENRPALTFIHLDNVDHEGHAHGWYSSEYYRAVEAADGYIGQVLDMLDALAARESTYVLVTSDHGGTAHGHGKNSLAGNPNPLDSIGAGHHAGPRSGAGEYVRHRADGSLDFQPRYAAVLDRPPRSDGLPTRAGGGARQRRSLAASRLRAGRTVHWRGSHQASGSRQSRGASTWAYQLKPAARMRCFGARLTSSI